MAASKRPTNAEITAARATLVGVIEQLPGRAAADAYVAGASAALAWVLGDSPDLPAALT
jgi:hypothetical protein